MRISTYFLMCCLCGLSFAGSVAAAKSEPAYVVEEQGRSIWRAAFDKKMATSAEQWEYARATQNKGWLRKADRRMLYLVRRWPNSKEAPWAARARADMLYARGKLDEAFDAYQYLIDNYSSRMADYDSVLESQFEIAVKIMNHRRMRLIFGGFRAPGYAVDNFETIIRNGPQWARAPEAQFKIGQCHQEEGDYELAISAYGLLGYRYPDCKFAEEAAWQQIVCLGKLREDYPNSPEMLDRMLTSTSVFLTTYQTSEYRPAIIGMRNELYEVCAGEMLDKAEFYEKVPKKPKAAILYGKAMIEEYPKSELVPEAKERVSSLEELLNQPEEKAAPVAPHSKPLPFG